jgi:hypothetical protein
MSLKLTVQTYATPLHDSGAQRVFWPALRQGMAAGTLPFAPSPDYRVTIGGVTRAGALSETSRRIARAARATLPHD